MRMLILFLLIVSLGSYAQPSKHGIIKVKKKRDVREMPDFTPNLEKRTFLKDSPPEFVPFGAYSMMRFIDNSMQRPPKLRRGSNLICKVSFDIDSTGQHSNAKVEQSVKDCPECDVEALRIVNSFPCFRPCVRDQRKINSRLIINVDFSQY